MTNQPYSPKNTYSDIPSSFPYDTYHPTLSCHNGLFKQDELLKGSSLHPRERDADQGGIIKEEETRQVVVMKDLEAKNTLILYVNIFFR